MSKWGRDPAVKPVPDHTCSVCGGEPRVQYDKLRGRWKVFSTCLHCGAGGKNKNKTGHHVAHKKDRCEECGFIPEHPSQLDVDHIDGNRYNNDPSNFKTLCANCHRLKTHKERNYATTYYDDGVVIGSGSGPDSNDATIQLNMWSDP